MSEMVEVTIDSVRVSLMSPQRLVVLRDANNDRYLPIWVGPYEAESITVALNEIEIVRPLTHDLLKNLFTTFGAHIKRVEIVALREDIFYGNIVAEADGQTINIDSRPSDAIALAVRAHVPILVDPAVMTTAGISPEQDLRSHKPPQSAAINDVSQSTQSVSPSAPAPSKPASSVEEIGRLSIFEDFLSKLDTDTPPSEPDDPDKPETK
ncbi:MAG: bifunctional nuclease family protein [Chloroflexi bacterium]|nr:bifunctional nuclease family protein [Chloroflexota bacterium]